jgi:WD40 repeat protein
MLPTRWPALAVVLLSAPAVAAPLPESPDGPLPPGAVARFGSAPLRHRGPVRAACFSVDGKAVATVGGDGVIRLWDVSTGRQLSTCPGPANVWSVFALLPDGRHVLLFDRRTDGPTREAQLTDLNTGQVVRTFAAKRNMMTIAVSPDRKLLAGAAVDGTYLWEVGSGRELHRLGGHTTTVEQVAFSADGKRLATIAGDRLMILWDVATGKEMRRFPVPPNVVWFALAWSPDGKALLLPGQGVAAVLDAESGEVVRRLVDREAETVYSFAFSPDGKLLATGHRGSVIALWDWATGEQVVRFHNRGSYESYRSLTFSPDGKLLAAAGEGERLRVFETGTPGQPALKPRDYPSAHPGPIVLARFTPDGRRLIVASAGPFDYETFSQPLTVVGWALEGRREAHRFTLDRAGTAVDLSPDGKRLAVWAGGVKLLDVTTGKVDVSLPTEPEEARAALARQVKALRFAPDGKRLAIHTFRNSRVGEAGLAVWGLEKQEIVLEENVQGRQPHGFVFGPRGLTARFDQTGFMVEGGEQPLKVTTGPVRSLLFAPDGAALVTDDGKDLGRLRLWSVTTGKELTAPAADGPVSYPALAFSTDGKLLAGGGADGVVRVWDVATGKLRHRLDGHRGPVQALHFAADGRLVSGAADGTALVWDLARAPVEK